MARRPKDRYATAGALADEVRRWLADEPVAAHPDKPLMRLNRWVRRHTSAAVAAVSALIIAAISISPGLPHQAESASFRPNRSGPMPTSVGLAWRSSR